MLPCAAHSHLVSRFQLCFWCALQESDYVVVAPNPGEIALGALEDAEAALRLRPNSEPALGYKVS